MFGQSGRILARLPGDFHINPVLARLIVNRDVREPEDIRKYLYGDTNDFYPPEQMKDLTKAADMIMAAIKAGKKNCGRFGF